MKQFSEFIDKYAHKAQVNNNKMPKPQAYMAQVRRRRHLKNEYIFAVMHAIVSFVPSTC